MSWADARLAFDLGAAIIDRDRPVMVNLIVTRRCNLSCSYCFEYDKISPPVPLSSIHERLDHLARLRAVMVTLSGGESLLHPDIAAIVRAVRARGMTPSLNTNGTLLTRELIEELGRAGLYALQISVDNAVPTASSRKSLRVLLPGLHLLAAHATFKVRVNSVMGVAPPEETLEVVRAALALGFDGKCSLVRDARGEPLPLDARGREVYETIRRMRRRSSRLLSEDFQHEILTRGEVDWKCRAGARFFHVCEHGLVHLCAPRTGDPGIPLADYTVDHIRRAFAERKSCAARCPVAYAHQVSRLDAWRSQPDREGRVHLPVMAS